MKNQISNVKKTPLLVWVWKGRKGLWFNLNPPCKTIILHWLIIGEVFKYLFYSNTYFIQILIYYSNTYFIQILILFKYLFIIQILIYYSILILIFIQISWWVWWIHVWIVDEVEKVANLALFLANFSKSLSHVILWHFSGRFSYLSLFYRIYYCIPFHYKKEINLTHTKTQG